MRRSDAPSGAAVALERVADPRTPSVLYLASLAAGSRPTMAGAIRHIARALGYDDANDVPWHSMTYADTQGLRSWLASKYAPATANRYLSCLRGVLRQAWRLGLMTTEAYQRAIALEPVRGSRERPGRELTPGELRALLAICNVHTPIGARNSAVVSILYGCGLRRSELAALDVGDIAGTCVRVRKGKGNKARTAYLPAGGVERVAAWVRWRGEDPGPLFYPTRGGKTLNAWGQFRRGDRMCADNVRLILRALAKLAGVKLFTPHDLRRTFVGDLLDGGLDLVSVQKLAGHSNANTTASYDRRPERARSRSAEILSIPAIDGDPE